MIIHRVSIIPHPKRDVSSVLASLREYLAGKGVEITVGAAFAEAAGGGGAGPDEEKIYSHADLLIVLGGDGTMLHAAKRAAPHGVPLVGVNLGRIGYMSAVEPDELALLDAVFDGTCAAEERLMLNVTLVSSGGSRSYDVLNDAVISRGEFSRIVGIAVHNNGRHVTDYHADGVIVATPTGSTAYSMSAGGPIVDPAMRCMVVTPICPYSFINRSLIFSDGAELTLTRITPEGGVYLTLDGEENIAVNPGDSIIIKKSVRTTRLLSVKPGGFYKTVKEKIV